MNRILDILRRLRNCEKKKNFKDIKYYVVLEKLNICYIKIIINFL